MAERIRHALIFDEVLEFCVAVIADRAIQGDGVGWCRQCSLHPLYVEAADRRDFLESWSTAQFVGQVLAGLLNGANNIHHVDGKSDSPRLIAETARNGLTYPPGGVGRELESFSPIKLLDRANESKVAFLDQVEKIKAATRIAFGDRDHEPEVGADELHLGFVAFVNEPIESCALLRG